MIISVFEHGKGECSFISLSDGAISEVDLASAIWSNRHDHVSEEISIILRGERLHIDSVTQESRELVLNSQLN